MIKRRISYCKRGEGGGQKAMIGIIISENVDNYGRPLTRKLHFLRRYGQQPGFISPKRIVVSTVAV